MSYLDNCRYKVRVIVNNKSITIRDKEPDNRAVYKDWGNKEWNCDIHTRIPASKYITDKYGNIYLPFKVSGSNCIVKIPINE